MEKIARPECIRRLKAAPEVRTFRAASNLIRSLGLSWQKKERRGEGRWAYAIVDHNPATGETLMVIWMQNCIAPEHRHKAGGLYGEYTDVLSGELTDVEDLITPSGVDYSLLYTLSRGQSDIHAGDTIHAPMTRTSCLLLVHHPQGVELLAA